MKNSSVVRIITRFCAVALTFLALTLSAAERVNINEASVSELASALKGVGPAKAQAIIEYREANGPFTKVSQLTDVKGIGKAILVENERSLVVSSSSDQ